MSPKILFTDLDGTLLHDRDKTVSPAMRKTLLQLLEDGHKLVLSSGRPLNSILEVIDSIGFPHPDGLYASAYNGALLYDCAAKRPLLTHTLPMDAVRYISEQAQSFGIHCHTYSDTHIIAVAKTPELIYYRQHIHLPVILSNPLTDALEKEPLKMIAIHLNDFDLLKRFRDSMLPWACGHIHILFSNEQYLEFFSNKAGKGSTLTACCKLLGIPIANSMAAGDADNDISMIESAGFGVAMQNASPTVKHAAQAITAEDNNQDGLLTVIRNFFGY